MITLKLQRKLIAITTALLIATAGTAFANPTSSDKLNKSKTLYNDSVKKVEAIEIQVEKLDNQIENAMAEVDTINKKADDTKASMIKTESDIKVIEKNIGEEQKLFGDRMEALYINGVGSYLDVLLEAKSFSDLISRVDTVKTIIEYDNKIMSNLNSEKSKLDAKKKGLVDEQAKLVALQTESKNKLAALNEDKSKQQVIIADLKAKTNLYAADIKAYEAAVASQSLSNQNNNSSNSSSSSSSSSSKPSKPNKPNNGGGNATDDVPNRGDEASGQAIVSYAKRFLGTPYVWGGTTPSGFDCSGFTSYVYRNSVGISLPRTSGAQAGVGKYIGSKGALQPGDLVFFGSPTHHVGIYVGGGQYIHSPQTGDVVKISNLTRGDFTHGRRLI